MQEFATQIGWLFIVASGIGVFTAIVINVVRLFLGRKSPQMVGAELPVTDAKIDLSKRYDIVYGDANEKLAGVRILGYLRSDRDQTTGEYMDSRWLVVELPDGRRAYLRPRSVLWLLETVAAEIAS